MLSGVVFVTVMLYVYVYSVLDNNRLLAKMQEDAQQAEYAFKAEQQAAEMRMLQIATFVVNDPEVQLLFLQGKNAVTAEGGGAGGAEAAKIRAKLYEHLRHGQEILAQQFQFRQLHFLLGPGALSFLRVHQVEKFGDKLNNVRGTVVATNATQQAVTGFETGRIVSGIRGVVPVFAVDSENGAKVYVGALDAGTSFDVTLQALHKNRPWLNGAVFLNKKHLQHIVWPKFLAEMLTKKQFIHDMRLEGTSSPQIDDLLQQQQFPAMLLTNGHQLLTIGDKHLNVISFALRDFRGLTDPQQPDVGRIVVWQDVSAAIATQKHADNKMMLYGLLLVISLELIIFFALRYLTSSLKLELDQSLQRQITSDKRAQVAAESARMKSTFLAMMGHELLTPLNTIIGMGQLLSTSSLEPAQQRYLGKINLSSQRLLNLISEVLTIVKLEDSSISEEATSFNLPHIVKRVTDHFSAQAQTHATALKSKIADQVPLYLIGYPDLVERILFQLVGNATKFSRGGEVTIDITMIKLAGERVTLKFCVADQGIGIAPGPLEQIFEPFYQVDSSISRAHEGAGLGLHLAQKICQQLGCIINVNSTVGVGSRFSFVLQLDVDSAGTVDLFDTTNTVELHADVAKTEYELGSCKELSALLQQLHIPLVNLQAKQCQQLAQQLSNKRWPSTYSEDVDKLILQIEGYRFSEAQEILAWLQKML